MGEANALYYVADDVSKQYANSEGGTTQQNDAHFIELAAALAIVDFASIPENRLLTVQGVPQGTVYKEFAIRNTTEQIIFGDLCDRTRTQIMRPMTQFVLFCKYMNEQIRHSRKQPWAIDLKFDDNFFHSSFYQSELSDMREAYMKWLEEMSANRRSFTPYDLREKKADVFSLLKGVKPAKLMTIKSNYALFDDVLNTEQTRVKRHAGKSHCFLELFYTATEKLVKSKYRISV
jgi:hypothetical protein